MNTLQNELNKINDELELLHYRKLQLEAIITEYNDVVNRAKNLIDLMMDNDVSPENFLMEIENLIDPGPMTPEEPEETEQPQEPDPVIIETIDLSKDERSMFLDVRHDQNSMRIFGFPNGTHAANWGEALERYGLTSNYEVYPIDNKDWLLVLVDVSRIDAQWVSTMNFSQHPNLVTVEPEPAPEATPTQEDECSLCAIAHNEPQHPQNDHPILWGIAQAVAQAEKNSLNIDLAELEQLNDRAWRDEDGWLYLGFTSESILKAWRKHFDKLPDIETYGETLDEFPYAFRVINHGHVASFWQEMRGMDFSKHPNKQQLKTTPEPVKPSETTGRFQAECVISDGATTWHIWDSEKAEWVGDEYFEKEIFYSYEKANEHAQRLNNSQTLTA